MSKVCIETIYRLSCAVRREVTANKPKSTTEKLDIYLNRSQLYDQPTKTVNQPSSIDMLSDPTQSNETSTTNHGNLSKLGTHSQLKCVSVKEGIRVLEFFSGIG